MRLDQYLFFVILWCISSADQVNDTLKWPLKDCLNSEQLVSCLAERASITFEQIMDNNVHISEGIQLLRNAEKINSRESKSLDAEQRLRRAISNFLDAHTLSIDLTKGRSLEDEEDTEDVMTARRKGGGGGGGGGGMFGMNKKALRKEKKYYQYAFMVLLGIFGLTGPLFMKVLGIMAAQSLLAAKAALIIVGGVALKKIFENSKSQPKVKVTTLPVHGESDEEHDRLGYGFNNIPFGYGGYGHHPYHEPYSAYVPGNSINDDNTQFAPILYGKHKSKRK